MQRVPHLPGLVSLVLLAGVCADVYAQKTTLTIQASEPGRQIGPDLVGVFFEDLNYAADGGLYAELIQNRSFEYSPTEQPSWNPLSSWELQKRGNGDGSITVAEMRPIHENNPHYALLTVRTPGAGVGLANAGFDGVPLKAGEPYEASFWAYQAFMGQMWGRGDNSKPMPVTLRLESKEGETLAEASMQVAGRQWRKVAARLTPTRTVNDARLVLLAHEAGGLCLDMVSLFPEKTFRNRPNGLRADLAQAVADIKPKFVRFPGGCLVHGGGPRRYYDWKETVGPVEQRRARRNSWGYHQTMGLGYFEYFQFCQDIGAKPLPVVTAGVCCQHAGTSPGRGQEGLPMEEMPAYVQDVLDLIEWANGPATSKWGSVRAAAGHPEPFGLKYVGVGNEDAITPLFKERFQMIYEAMKEKHPEITVIGTVGPFASGEDYDNGWVFARELNLAMVDEHYYVAPQWFWDNLHRYDKYDRTGAKVYVGEYAAHDRDRARNSLRSAIAEAAGMTAFERNGDVVQLASYAPLFARRNHTQWHPDMIYFTGTEVFLTPNYHVQQLFGQNSGDTYLATTLDATAKPPTLAASAVRDSKSDHLIIKIVNGANTSAALTVELAGLAAGELKATKTVLTGANADAFNEDGQSPAVKPAASEVTLKSTFDYEAPANSLTVFRILASPAAQPAAPPTATIGADAPKPPFATPLQWKSTGVLVKPVSDANHTIVSVKDPTIVRYNDLWHIYATAYSTSARTWTMVYLNFKDWSDAPSAKLTFIDVNPHFAPNRYNCAPHLFYFTPHKKWYLVFQAQPPQYCTTDDISKPETWTAPQNFFDRQVRLPRLPIDYHIICDDTHAYLFFTGDDGNFYRSRTKIEDFPKGMSEPEIAIKDRRDNLFEASITYKIKGTNTYLTVIEALSPSRYYRAWVSDDLNGAWTPVPGADSWQTPFAGINNVTFEDGVTPWTREISHGELIRDGYDERMILDPDNLQLLYQGRDPASGGRYELLPYQLGLLKLDRSKK